MGCLVELFMLPLRLLQFIPIIGQVIALPFRILFFIFKVIGEIREHSHRRRRRLRVKATPPQSRLTQRTYPRHSKPPRPPKTSRRKPKSYPVDKDYSVRLRKPRISSTHINPELATTIEALIQDGRNPSLPASERIRAYRTAFGSLDDLRENLNGRDDKVLYDVEMSLLPEYTSLLQEQPLP